MLNANNNRYIQWDPMWCLEDDQEVCWVIAANRIDDAWKRVEWWAQENTLIGYKRPFGSKEWEEFHRLPAFPGKRWCAGSVEPGGRMFLSDAGISTSDFFAQRLIYVKDGRVPWTYVPTKPMFTTGIAHRGGRGLFACRDPFYLNANGRHYLYVCSGGYRWHAQPEIVVFESRSIDGPYRPVGPVVKAVTFAGEDAFGELERVSVIQVHDTFWLLAHCWANVLGSTVRDRWGAGLKDPNTAVWLFVSDSPTGTFRLHAEQPYLKGSDELGLYGLQLKDDGAKTVGYGWDLASHSVTPECQVTVDWDTLTVMKE